MMREPLPPSSIAQIAILNHFRRLYLKLTVLFSILTIGVVAWHWNQPRGYANGLSYTWSVPTLLCASVLLNGMSFYWQRQYVRSLLRRPDLASTFRVGSFALRFYIYNLVTAIALSILCFFPLLVLFFFYWIYPVVFWLIPYHLLMGLIIGRDLRQRLQAES